MKRKGIADPALRGVLNGIALRLFQLNYPTMTPEELAAKKPEIEEITEYLFSQFESMARDTIDAVLDIMDQVGSFPALRKRIVEYKEKLE